MPFPKPRPLQSRLQASLVTSITVFILYLTFFSSHSAYASDVDSTSLEDYSREKLIDSHILDGEFDIDIRQASYEADFFGADRGIIGRADTGPQYIELLNNAPQRIEVKPGGATVYFSVQNVTLMGNTSQDQVGLPSPVRLLLRTENQPEEILKVPDSSGSGLQEIHNEVGTTNPILHPRQDGPATLYISLNTCQQPSDPTDISGTNGAPPQPQIYISQSSSNTLPGPGQSSDSQQQVLVVGGFANVTLQASGPVYIGIAAPNTTTFTQGSYLVEIAASVDAPFHSYLSKNLTLRLIDSDTTSALLVTSDLTNTTNGTLFDEWMSLYPPFSIFVVNANKTTIEGVQNSYCGLKTYADIAGVQGGPRSDNVESSLTNLTGSPYPKQQFYVQGLNGSSSYYGILAMTGNSTNSGAGVVGGGGEIMQSVTFQTQADGNCVLIYNLSFCNSVAYAVPGNPNTFPNATALGQWYDSQTLGAYINFQHTLAQIPCEIEPEGAYSLAKNCSDCNAAYTAWVCSVMIPRCVGFSSTNPLLQERNIFAAFPNGTTLDSSLLVSSQNVSFTNSSRNPNIDAVVQPGPYKELLPCVDLCYAIVQSCAAAMGFACPVPSMPGFNHSYGQRPQSGQVESLTCNFPGTLRDAQGAGSIKTIGYGWGIASVMLLIFIM